MNDTCATHRSRVPRRSFGRNKRRSDDIGRRERTSPGFRHQCNADSRYGKKEAGTGEHLNTFNNQINKHNRKAAAPHGRLPQTKHKLKPRPGPLSSSNVVTPPFIPSEAPPWDSRPVSGAGVVHYHSLHRPRSVPTALGPAPLVTGSL